MAVRVPEGAHTVRFNYMTPGLKYGVILTLGSIVILVLYILIVRTRKKRYPERWLVGYPEGDQLAARFLKDLADEAGKAEEEVWTALSASSEDAESAAPPTGGGPTDDPPSDTMNG